LIVADKSYLGWPFLAAQRRELEQSFDEWGWAW
jgi:hypothetical protein